MEYSCTPVVPPHLRLVGHIVSLNYYGGTPHIQVQLFQSMLATFSYQLHLHWFSQKYEQLSIQSEIVLCEYSKFRVESNSYFSIRFDSKRAQLFKIFEYLPSLISYLFDRMTPIFHLSNQQNLLLTMVQVLYHLEVFILGHYGPPSTETPKTTIVQCHKNS